MCLGILDKQIIAIKGDQMTDLTQTTSLDLWISAAKLAEWTTATIK